MKHKGAKYEYEQERNNDLLRTFKKLLVESEEIHLPSIYQEVVNSPSERFWVSEERAAIVIASMLRGKDLAGMRPNKREMFQEIYRRFLVLRKQKPNATIMQLCFEIVRQPAPKFYLSPISAEISILNAKKRWYEERKQKLRHLF